MFQKLRRWIAWLVFTGGMASAQNFLLGVNYSEFVPTGSITILYDFMATATDSQGDIYLLLYANTGQAFFSLIKLTPAGDRVVYQNNVPFTAYCMAVDASGNVYLAGQDFVEKLGADGATPVYKTSFGQNTTVTGLAVDAAGRLYAAGYTPGNGIQTTPGALQQTPPSAEGPENAFENAFVVRFTPSGAIDYATYLGGSSQAQPASIAVDSSGSAFVAGIAFSPSFPTTPGAYLPVSAIPNFTRASFLARLSPNGSSLVYSTLTDAQGNVGGGLALDASDHAVVILLEAGGASVLRFNPEGTAVIFSDFLPGTFYAGSLSGSLSADASGNTYLALPAVANYPVKNSLASCDADGFSALTVLDEGGNILQST
jgi:hypothetical protein